MAVTYLSEIPYKVMHRAVGHRAANNGGELSGTRDLVDLRDKRGHRDQSTSRQYLIGCFILCAATSRLMWSLSQTITHQSSNRQLAASR